jgi:hypothetical protein
MISLASRPWMRGIADDAAPCAAWQPEHEVAPGGGADAASAGLTDAITSVAISTFIATDPDRCANRRAASRYAKVMSCFFSGTERIRLPVAAKNALSTAGAATQIVGSPTPPQNPPDGIRIDSTFGISLSVIDS